jgi:23S rRNA pseudouridine1911/1915/1917 synthase
VIDAEADNFMDIPILYEDDVVVVIDKPSGVMVHGDGRTERETVTDWLVARFPQVRGVGEPITLQNGAVMDRPGIVHRLDTETSGVLVLAKTQDAFTHLKGQFHDRYAQKEYRAFVYGRMQEVTGVIDRPIGRSTQDFRLRSAQRGARGLLREAVTEWERITAGDTYSYVRFFPKTGRTHQIRVHAKAINHPIVHDELYAPARLASDAHPLGFDRLALHAYMLTIELPSGRTETFTAPLPSDFLRAEGLIRGVVA